MILALYIVLWSLVIVLWALEVCFGASAFAGIAGCAVGAVRGNWVLAIASLGVGLFFAGISIFLYFGCVAATKGMAKLTKKIALGIKSRLVGKEKTK